MRREVKTILDVTIQETVADKTYIGNFVWKDVVTTFTLNFEISAFAPAAYLPGHHKLSFAFGEEPVSGPLASTLYETLFIPLSMVIGILIDRRMKGHGATATLKMPVITDEETHQFTGPDDILNYLLELNP